MQSGLIQLSPDTVYYHITHWKAGSQWFLGLLKDAFNSAVVEPREAPKHLFAGPPERGKVYPCCYISRGGFLKIPMPPKTRRFVLIRDLRDTLISGYFSIRYTHASNRFVDKWRVELNRLPLEDGLIYLIDQWLPGSAGIQQTWLKREEHIVKLEEFMSSPADALWRVFFEAWQLELQPQDLQSLLSRHPYIHYSRGRAPGEEDLSSHYRKGIHGDWRNHFTPRVTEHFKHRYSGLLVQAGYEQDASWGAVDL